MRIIAIGVTTFVVTSVLCVTCAVSSSATEIHATVNPVRIIHIDSSGDIVRITSNTPRPVEPVVRKIGFIETDAVYDKSVQTKFEHVIGRYDMSKPIEIQVKELGFWENLENYIINPIAAIL